MISDFLCAAHWRLYYLDDSSGLPKVVYTTEVIKYGSRKSDDRWWNAEKMVEQTKKAISIVEKAFSGDIPIFAFDNSSGHTCKAKDALVANHINLNPDSKHVVLRNMEWGNGHKQSMVFEEGDKEWGSDEPIAEELLAEAKGITQILQEWGL
jgi:hypothetical protein